MREKKKKAGQAGRRADGEGGDLEGDSEAGGGREGRGQTAWLTALSHLILHALPPSASSPLNYYSSSTPKIIMKNCLISFCLFLVLAAAAAALTAHGDRNKLFVVLDKQAFCCFFVFAFLHESFETTFLFLAFLCLFWWDTWHCAFLPLQPYLPTFVWVLFRCFLVACCSPCSLCLPYHSLLAFRARLFNARAVVGCCYVAMNLKRLFFTLLMDVLFPVAFFSSPTLYNLALLLTWDDTRLWDREGQDRHTAFYLTPSCALARGGMSFASISAASTPVLPAPPTGVRLFHYPTAGAWRARRCRRRAA